jgi:hypothetical protein
LAEEDDLRISGTPLGALGIMNLSRIKQVNYTVRVEEQSSLTIWSELNNRGKEQFNDKGQS